MKAAVYARKSTEQNGVADEERSVTRQVEHATAYAEKRGWAVNEEYIFIDDGISGAEFAKRPGFLRLMNALKPRPPFDVLVMSEESRLGREAIEVGFALKQLVTSGVRVFCYLTDTERTLNSPIEKAMLSLQAMADEMEREKARQRTADAMQHMFELGLVTGGRVFGYDNVRTDEGSRPRTRRFINEQQAAVVRRIFELRADGEGFAAIAKRLNSEGVIAPRPQQNRLAGWCASSVREVTNRPLYCGDVVYNQTRKRNAWGQVAQAARPEADHRRRHDPALRIVSDELWSAVQAQNEAAKNAYLRHTNGRVWGRPAGGDSKYLLPGFATCGVCGGFLEVRQRRLGKEKVKVYACATYHRKGTTVCDNRVQVRMEDVDSAVLTKFEDDVMNPEVVRRGLRYALDAIRPGADQVATRKQVLVAERQKIEQELDRLADAIATGTGSTTVLNRIQQGERRVQEIERELRNLIAPQFDERHVQSVLRDALLDWRGSLRRHVPQARQMLRKLLVGKLAMMPVRVGRKGAFDFTGEASLGRLITGLAGFPQAVASPPGFEPGFQP
jgi:site-specific DNA recombinase